VYQALYLDALTERCLAEKIAALYAILPGQIQEILVHVPSGIYVLVTDLVSCNLPGAVCKCASVSVCLSICQSVWGGAVFDW